MQQQRLDNNNNNQNNEIKDDGLSQLFGKEQESIHQDKVEFSQIRNSIDVENMPIRVNDSIIQNTFIGVGVMFALEALFMAINMQVTHFIGAVILAFLSFLITKKLTYKYDSETNYFMNHLTITLKGTINHFRTTSILMEASEKILIYSIIVIAIQHFLLSWFSLSSIIYSFGYYGMIIGILLNFAKRKTDLLAKGMYLYSMILALMTIQNVLMYQYISYHTSVSLLIFLYLAGFFKSLNIKEVHIDKK